ncbi:hypothetical protein SPRG_00410 [Saprolegnia parasitica CBS 223.65]|uniref:PX domain-containing protein n=1 Tax=Saprolegnia parasitica (strain CBS 223.65) TaxID=695850 RepID=A0A067D984_SAPPC|nr:hypothetical protein SPRG_00410 [Saprolegnia parasitica CBS 223.65]KDO35567.1 hypothetical protein SPRG_00410 [Saprolegnia parasitica CBS 223.65]|eukprot:XP_012193899.1 hypothetical protein SPRG_00410 [Saprolegnia parasitica CBS 223.65]
MRTIDLDPPSIVLCTNSSTYTLHVHDAAASWSIDRGFSDFVVLRTCLLRLLDAQDALVGMHLRALRFPRKLFHRWPRQWPKLLAFVRAANALCGHVPTAIAVLDDFLGADCICAPAPKAAAATLVLARSRLLSLSELCASSSDDEEIIDDIAFELGLWGLTTADVCLVLDVLLRTIAKARLGIEGAYVLTGGAFQLDTTAFVRRVLSLTDEAAVQALFVDDGVPDCLVRLAHRVWCSGS